ncbi:MAG: phenylalanine--tRNA ligase subunit beta [Candidatus Nanohaloarchaea archaeon]
MEAGQEVIRVAHIKININEFQELLGEEVELENLGERASFLGAHWNHVEGDKWDVEQYPNRPDLLSVEGLARAYRGFFGVNPGREEYEVEDGEISVEVDGSVEDVRPYIGGAVVRNVELTQRLINGLIQLQEKMHETMGRRRDKLAIGLHDLSAVEPDFTYRAVEPEKVSFTPLEYDRELALGEILEEHEKGREYAWILDDEDRYPVIEDAGGKILSFPPIINNQLTEVHTGTDDIFIDVTGKDEETVRKALNILVTALAERGGEIESVEIEGEELPDLSPEIRELDVEYFKEVSGLDLSAAQIARKLEEMKHGAEKKDSGTVSVEVPCYRTDVMHQYDLIEDVVIAHGYDNIEPQRPEIDQEAKEKDIEDLARIVREAVVGTGALETNTFILSSPEKLSGMMQRDEKDFVEMENALTESYSAVRNWLLPSLMGVLNRNRHRAYPQEFFEVEEVSELDDSYVGASNTKKLAYVVSDGGVDFNDAREVLQVLERELGVDMNVEREEKPFFRQQRSAKIELNGEEVGFIGQFSEKVRENWELEHPVAGFELDLDRLNRML